MKKVKRHSPEYQKNEVRLKLLTLLPSFQEDVKKIRNELNIPLDGLSNDVEFKNWYEEKMIKESDIVIESKQYQESVKRVSRLQYENYPEFLKQKWEVEDTIPLNKMNNRQLMLIEKYNLPGNFNRGYSDTLFTYITKNVLRPPSNNWGVVPDTIRGHAKSISITTFAPLSGAEFKQAKKCLGYLQEHYFPKQIMISSRVKKQFDRDFEIYKELALRTEIPIKKRKYVHQSYLSYVAGAVPSKTMKKLERQNKNDIEIYFSEKTSKEVAKKFKATPTAVRKSLQRIHELIEKLFP